MRGFIISTAVLLASPSHLLVRLVQGQLKDSPDNASFLRRSRANAVVVGNYVYVDGGDISQLDARGNPPPSDRPSNPMNSTLSISIKESWTPPSVFVATWPKNESGAPILSSQVIWPDPNSSSFYSWGGGAFSGSKPPASNEIWQFTADGAGSGNWSQAKVSNPRVFSQLLRSEGCAFTSANGMGYCLGGLASPGSDPSISSTNGLALPGMVTFGMRSGVWTNTTTAGFQDLGTLMNGRAEFAPFGTSGILIFLGGSESPPGGSPSSSRQVDFSTIPIYDLASQTWLVQATSGDRPASRERFCSVGVQGPNGTYEIYMYGGMSTEIGGASQDVYVLSLPGFVFYKASNSGSLGVPRADHSCVVIGSGKRQFMSIGGIAGFRSDPNSFLDRDPWAQGIGVFDMTEFEWAFYGYNASAAPYQSPNVIAKFYADGGFATVPWTSDAVRALFATASPSFAPQPDEPEDNSNNHPNSALMAIIGAAVGAAVVSFLAVGCLCYRVKYYRRILRTGTGAASRTGSDLDPVASRPPRVTRTMTQSSYEKPPSLPDLPQDDAWIGYTVQVRGNATPVASPGDPARGRNIEEVLPPMQRSFLRPASSGDMQRSFLRPASSGDMQRSFLRPASSGDDSLYSLYSTDHETHFNVTSQKHSRDSSVGNPGIVSRPMPLSPSTALRSNPSVGPKDKPPRKQLWPSHGESHVREDIGRAL